MTISKTLGALALSLTFSVAAQADVTAGLTPSLHQASSTAAAPSPSYTGQWWTHPIGCEYSRAGRGGETVWYLIINTAKRGCPSYIVTHSPYGDVY